MPKHLMMLVIGLFFGAGGGFLAAAASNAELPGHDHAAHGSPHGEHHDHNALLAVPEDRPAPEITLELHPDPGGWNLHIAVENFRFAPEHVNGDPVAGEGHAHIHVDGVKLARVYGPWFHLADLPEDATEIRVTLNANSHETLAVGDTPIAATVTLER